MAYGFELDGILGMDFLRQAGAVIDLAQLEIRVVTPLSVGEKTHRRDAENAEKKI